jgi:Tfp pilus assembly protein PilO
MNKESYYKKILLGLIVCVISVFVVFFYLYKQLVKKNENIANLLDRISSESSREVYAASVQKQLQTIDPDLKLIKTSIVGQTGVVSFIEELEKVAKNNGLTIENDSIAEETDPKSVASSTIVYLKVRSKTKGSWDGTYKFLSEIESLSHKVRINSFNMVSSGSDSGSSGKTAPKNNWDAVFEIRVLKYK